MEQCYLQTEENNKEINTMNIINAQILVQYLPGWVVHCEFVLLKAFCETWPWTKKPLNGFMGWFLNGQLQVGMEGKKEEEWKVHLTENIKMWATSFKDQDHVDIFCIKIHEVNTLSTNAAHCRLLLWNRSSIILEPSQYLFCEMCGFTIELLPTTS